jgi:hypothetical protein
MIGILLLRPRDECHVGDFDISVHAQDNLAYKQSVGLPAWCYGIHKLLLLLMHCKVS